MPELKVVLYIMGGIGYFVYSVYKKNKEAQAEKEAAEKKRRAQYSSTPPPIQYQQPKPAPRSESFDDYNKRTTAKPVTTTPAKKKQDIAKAIKPIPAKPKQFLITDEGASYGGEGTAYEQKYTRPITSEETIHDEISNSRAIMGEIEEEETPNIDVRQALIGSFIFERKF